jgi:hypothetical protein
MKLQVVFRVFGQPYFDVSLIKGREAAVQSVTYALASKPVRLNTNNQQIEVIMHQVSVSIGTKRRVRETRTVPR